MVPHKSRRGRTGNAGRKPVAGSVTPHVPVAALDVALCAIDEFVHAVGLVIVKLQGLRYAGVSDIESHIVLEVCGRVGCSELFPPESVRVRGGSADAELGG